MRKEKTPKFLRVKRYSDGVVVDTERMLPDGDASGLDPGSDEGAGVMIARGMRALRERTKSDPKFKDGVVVLIDDTPYFTITIGVEGDIPFYKVNSWPKCSPKFLCPNCAEPLSMSRDSVQMGQHTLLYTKCSQGHRWTQVLDMTTNRWILTQE